MALAPATQMARLAHVVGGDIVEFTARALAPHRYQHNGPDPDGLLSDIPSAALSTCRIASRLAGGAEPFRRVCGG
ncbi:MAG: hypothetical protein ACP5HD_05260 [Thermoproteus sp.]